MISDERLRALHRYWLGKRGGRKLPSRADLDPTELPGPLWRHIIMIDVVEGTDGAPRLRYRRLGMAFAEAFGQDSTGRFLDEVLPERGGYRAFVTGLYAEVVALRLPVYSENHFVVDGQSVPLLAKRVCLPLSRDGDVIDIVMAGLVFEHHPSLTGQIHPLISGYRELVRVPLEE